MTTILVTHDRQEALSMSDRVAVMENGTILQLDIPDVIYNLPCSRRVADFFGCCSYLRGQVTAGVFRSGNLEIPAQYPDGAYELLLRPHNFCPEIPGSYPATVESVRFRGEDSLVIFRGQDGTLWKHRAGRNHPWKQGDRIHASVVPDQTLLFRL
jgi:putative spermidine/putrescine transport system ATP-binding protein